jgi:hypothetical protein
MYNILEGTFSGTVFRLFVSVCQCITERKILGLFLYIKWYDWVAGAALNFANSYFDSDFVGIEAGVHKFSTYFGTTSKF